MTKQNLQYVKAQASKHTVESITHVSCRDIRDLLDERERLRKALESALKVFNAPKIDPMKAFVAVEMMRHTLNSVNK